MSQSKQSKKIINGILNLDKPLGISSNKALQKVKYLFQAKKAGHTGNLDPLASGVLPICFGHATKLSQYLLDADKKYQAGICLGKTTTTGDLEGDITSEVTCKEVSKQLILECLDGFLGEQEQIPPMYSALKVDGQPLYKLARQGKQIERKSRTINIYDLRLLDYNFPQLLVEVHCSKGTYIRTLAESIGESLGCGAVLSSLRRIKSSIFSIETSISMEQVEAAAKSGDLMKFLSPMDAVLQDYPEIELTSGQTEDILYGRKVRLSNSQFLSIQHYTEIPESYIRLYAKSNKLSNSFLGLAVVEDNFLQPKRIFY